MRKVRPRIILGLTKPQICDLLALIDIYQKDHPTVSIAKRLSRIIQAQSRSQW